MLPSSTIPMTQPFPNAEETVALQTDKIFHLTSPNHKQTLVKVDAYAHAVADTRNTSL